MGRKRGTGAVAIVAVVDFDHEASGITNGIARGKGRVLATIVLQTLSSKLLHRNIDFRREHAADTRSSGVFVNNVQCIKHVL